MNTGANQQGPDKWRRERISDLRKLFYHFGGACGDPGGKYF